MVHSQDQEGEYRGKLRTEFDHGLVNTSLTGFTEFRKGGTTKPLLEMRCELATRLFNFLPEYILKNYCSFTYLRQAFSREVMPVIFDASIPDVGHAVFKQNYRQGFQQLNRVLDALSTASARIEFSCCLRITFEEPKVGEMSNGLDVNAGAAFRLQSEVDARYCPPKGCAPGLYAHLIVPDQARVKWPSPDDPEVSVFPTLPTDEPDFLTSGRLFSPGEPLYHEGIAAVESLCYQFGLESNTVAYRSLIAAIYELHTYREKFGREVISFFLRSPDPTSFATGFTLISSELLTEQALDILFNATTEFHSSICGGLTQLSPDSSSPLGQAISAIQRFDPGKLTASQVPERVTDAVTKVIRESIGGAPRDSYFLAKHGHSGAKEAVKHSVNHFLNTCLEFCDEFHEGRPLEFGLVLGNPFMFRFWPGARPLLVNREHGSKGLEEFQNLSLRELVKQVHLIEDPQQRFVVMTYGAKYDPDENVQCAAFVLDLANFHQAIVTWSQGLMWSATGRIYAYITQRYLLSVAALVGPGSQIRVFCGGKFVAYRGGKGWLVWDDPSRGIESALMNNVTIAVPNDADSKRRDIALRSLPLVLSVALQLSKFIRRESHGGLIVWTHDEKVYGDGSYDQGSRGSAPGSAPPLIALQPLDSVEPVRLDEHARNWLRGESLIKRRGNRIKDGDSGGIELSYEVAKLVLRASQKDGAVCLAGEECKVIAFGQRIVFPGGGGAHGDRGTKHATAKTFSSIAGEDAFAIAISADGPITVYYHNLPPYSCLLPA